MRLKNFVMSCVKAKYAMLVLFIGIVDANFCVAFAMDDMRGGSDRSSSTGGAVSGSSDGAGSGAVAPKFKIGFEFQESHRLCEWAADDPSIQKKPIITVSKGGRELWHLEIDTMDLEFVTAPFTNHEQMLLLESIDTILLACEVLQSINNSKTQKENGVLLNEWLGGIEATDAAFAESANRLIKATEAATAKGAIVLEATAKKARQYKYALRGLRRQLEKSRYTIEVHPEMHTVFQSADRPIMIRAGWKPIFQPQVTVQHPLSKTIPLVVALFGPDESSLKKLKILHALPDVSLLRQPETSSHEGLIFLHALTCVQLVDDVERTEADLIEETSRHLEDYHQADAKVRLNFLSRRPFSTMWSEIKRPSENFAEIYRAAMGRNSSFSYLIDPSISRFPLINYAEEYDLDGERVDLSYLMDRLKQDTTLDEAAKETMQVLLKKGILSTEMIRQFKPKDDFNPEQIFQHYFESVVQSVDHPTHRYDFDAASRDFYQVPYEFDALSPPWFLDVTDPMGAYRDDTVIDSDYGAALVEFRSIKNIGIEALRRMGVSQEHRDQFLVNERISLQEHATVLFTLLERIL